MKLSQISIAIAMAAAGVALGVVCFMIGQWDVRQSTVVKCFGSPDYTGVFYGKCAIYLDANSVQVSACATDGRRNEK